MHTQGRKGLSCSCYLAVTTTGDFHKVFLSPDVLCWWPLLLTLFWPSLGWVEREFFSLLSLEPVRQIFPLSHKIADTRIKYNKTLWKVGSEWRRHSTAPPRLVLGPSVGLVTCLNLHLPPDVKKTATSWSLDNTDYPPRKRSERIPDISGRLTSRALILCSGLIIMTNSGKIHSLLANVHLPTYRHVVCPLDTIKTITASSDIIQTTHRLNVPLGADIRWRSL